MDENQDSTTQPVEEAPAATASETVSTAPAATESTKKDSSDEWKATSFIGGLIAGGAVIVAAVAGYAIGVNSNTVNDYNAQVPTVITMPAPDTGSGPSGSQDPLGALLDTILSQSTEGPGGLTLNITPQQAGELLALINPTQGGASSMDLGQLLGQLSGASPYGETQQGQGLQGLTQDQLQQLYDQSQQGVDQQGMDGTQIEQEIQNLLSQLNGQQAAPQDMQQGQPGGGQSNDQAAQQQALTELLQKLTSQVQPNQ